MNLLHYPMEGVTWMYLFGGGVWSLQNTRSPSFANLSLNFRCAISQEDTNSMWPSYSCKICHGQLARFLRSPRKPTASWGDTYLVYPNPETESDQCYKAALTLNWLMSRVYKINPSQPLPFLPHFSCDNQKWLWALLSIRGAVHPSW